ncbi:hypothetical protein DFQ26_001990 [Actinomortierella ambigua]|nr:hypothetical protein DFQ26_001990 [Actinomortierella ambigua]
MSSDATIKSRWSSSSEITAVTFTPDGKSILCASHEYSIQKFENDNNFSAAARPISTQEPVTCLVVDKSTIYTGAVDGAVRKYTLRDDEFDGVISRWELEVRAIDIARDGNLLAVGFQGPDIKIINQEDPEKCFSLRGHSKAINSLSFDPKGQYLISSSCDGTAKVWDLTSKDTTALHTIEVMKPTTTDSEIRAPVAWHPSGDFFVVGFPENALAYHRVSWRKAFTYRTGAKASEVQSKAAVAVLAWSSNGKFLAAASPDSDVWVWQYKSKDKPAAQHKHKKGRISSMSWAPNSNRLAYGDTTGELSRWDNVVNEEELGSASLTSKAKDDPLDDLFNDGHEGQDDMQVEDMDAEYLSESDPLRDFIEDDDDGAYVNTKPPAALSGRPATATQVTHVLHPRVQPGSTPLQDKRRYLAFNLLGIITSVQHDQSHSTVSVEFHDKVAHRGYHFTDTSNFSMASLGENGALYASESKDERPSTVYFKTHDSWASKSEWQVFLNPGEEAEAVALSAESAIVATSLGYVRIFSQSGIQTGLFCVDSVVAIAGKEDLVMVVHRAGPAYEGSHNLVYSIFNMENNQRIQCGKMPITDQVEMTWLGFSEGCIPACFDSAGVMYILNNYRMVDQGLWVPILDTNLIDPEEDEAADAPQPVYWPIGLSEEAMTCVKCRRGQQYPSLPKPSRLTEVQLKMPTLYQETPTGQQEEGWLRSKILVGLTRHERLAMSLDAMDSQLAKKELEMDKLVIQMIDLACRGDRTQKALDLTAMLCNLRSIDAAVKIAHHHNLHSLMERMNKVKEIKMMAANQDDPLELERQRVLTEPVLAERTGDPMERAVRMPSRREREEQVLQSLNPRRTTTTSASSNGGVGGNAGMDKDPFGRRVIKDKPTTSASSSSSAATGGNGVGGSNPFKKKFGSTGSSGNTGGGGGAPKFGVVKPAAGEGNAPLPLMRRANSIFDAVDYISADDRRAKQAAAASEEADKGRKRKAQGASSGSGGQATLAGFGGASSKGINGSTSSSSALSTSEGGKRFKGTNGAPLMSPIEGEEDGMADMLMDADDFLEDMQDEDEEVLPPPGQVIPQTQDDDDDLLPRFENHPADVGARDVAEEEEEEEEEQLERTRHRLANTSVTSPVQQSRASLLDTFKFNR